MKTLIIQLAIFLYSFSSFLIAQSAGDLDITFGSLGKVSTDLGNTEYGYSVVIQPDGKIIMAGLADNGSDIDFALTRYNSDGTLDNTFDSDGKVITDLGSYDDESYSIAVQPDEKIVVAGYSGYGSDYNFALTRYKSDGTLDNEFGTGGKVLTDFGNIYDGALSVAIQMDGKIVAAGYSASGSNSDFALARYNNNGILDSTFDSDGKVITDFGFGDDYCFSVAIQTDGKIVTAGYTLNGILFDFALCRHNIDGSLDSTFGIDGKVKTDFGSSFDECYSIAIQPDGKIVAAGYANNGSDYDFAVGRYNTNGNLDSTFGSDGKVTTDFGSLGDHCYTVAIQTDGKIIASGRAYNGADYDFALARYNIDGTLDNIFGIGGKVTTDFGGLFDYGYSVAIQTDSKIVVAGYSGNDFAVARYLAEGLELGLIDLSTSNNSTFIYPNPINQNAILNYTLGKEETVSISLFDSEGKKIKSFIENNMQQAGKHEQLISIDEHLAAGNYFVVISTASSKVSIEIMK